MKAETLSIVVCTYNQADRLAETLRCLRAQEGAAVASDFEVLVVNNRCTDHTSAVVAAAGFREVMEPIPGQVHARVRGVRESAGEWVAFVDDDNYMAPDWVANARRFIAAHPGCGAFGGTVEILWERPPPPAVARRAYAYAATDLPGGERRLAGDERWRLRGAGLVCRRQALRDAGWMDWRANVGRAGTGTMAGDDTEIVMRIARAGWELWVAPGCRLRHAIAARRLTVPYLRALHRGFAAADPVLLGFQGRGSLAGWAGRLALLLARRVYWLGRHAWRGRRDADARLTALLTLDTLRGNLAGLTTVARLGAAGRKVWLGGQTPSVRPGPSSSLRVLHLHRGRDYGGLERMLLCLGVDRAACFDMEPVFGLGHRERLARELTAAGARTEILGETSFRHPWRTLGALWGLRRLMRREKFDAAVCHGSSALVFFGGGAWGLGVPVVLWMHSDTKVRNKNFVEWLAGRVRPALVICNSAFTAASLPLLFAVPPPRVIVPCPVPRPSSSPPDRGRRERRAALRAELTTPPDAVVIILPSRLEAWKGHRVLLDALGSLRDLPGWLCWVVGGPFDETQERFLQALIGWADAGGISARMRFVGQRADVPELLAAADIFCQPNLTPEPFGVNVIEALYAGLPVVGSDSGGTREIVDETCGRLVTPGDVPALASELGRLIRDADLRRGLGARAAARGEAVSSPGLLLPILRDHLAQLAQPRTRATKQETAPSFASTQESPVLGDPSLNEPVVVHSLVGAAQVKLAVKCLGSLLAAVSFPVRFALHDDGSLDPAARATLAAGLGPAACTFVDHREAGEQMAERLRRHPRCAKFRAEHLFGPKLFDVPLLSVGRAVYADTDVLWTRPLDCPAYFRGGGPAFVVMRDLQEAYAVRLSRWSLMQKRGIRLASRFCAGLMSLDPAALDLDYVEWLLGVDAADDLFGGFRFWAEQTIYAALAARAGCAWIDPRECAVVHHRTFARTRDAAILHFAGFSRDLFDACYREATLPADPADRAPVRVLLGTEPTPVCGVGRRVLSAWRTRVLLRDSARKDRPVASAPAPALSRLPQSAGN